MYVFFSIVW